MPDEKDHNCKGVNCIYCQMASEEQLTIVSNLTLINEQALARIKALDPTNRYGQYEAPRQNNTQLEQWEKLAFFDQLTGLFNVHVFLKELTYEVARADRYKRPLTIGILCIDNYQELKNDYGPLGCGLTLKHVGNLLQETLREVDLSARLQLEQFGIILPETNQAGGNIVAERIRQTLLKNPVKINALNLDITCSIGISSFPKHGTDADKLLNSCLNAQNEAANKGGNKVLAL
jgi:two-component system, cell cycle response regulator